MISSSEQGERSPAVAPESHTGTQLVLLGTGTPNPDPERSGPAVAVIARGRAYLVDCGPGVVRRAAAAARKGIPALAADQLGIVFITHLHSDHTLGLPDLIHEIRAGVVYRDSNVTVRAFEVPHANWPRGHAFGYRFQTADRTIVISGDTRPSEAVVRACAGCDVLLHEVYSVDRFRERSAEWQRYHRDAHTSTIELAAVATRAHPKLLVLYHQLFWGATDEDLVREVRRDYSGAVVSGHDLDVFPGADSSVPSP